MSMDCSDCLYEVNGDCRRYAPRPSDSTMSTAVWPPVEPIEWCGDWRNENEDWRADQESPHALLLRDMLVALEASPSGVRVAAIGGL